MTRMLAVNWNAHTLRFVHAEGDRQGRLRLLDAGRVPIREAGEAADSSILAVLKRTVIAQKAEKSRLLILLNRGSVDSATFKVPPATEAELPAIVRNMAMRSIPGTSDESLLDFVAYPAAADGTRSVSAMALLADDQQLIRGIIQEFAGRPLRILVGGHPLRVFADGQTEGNERQTTLIVARGTDAADVLVTTGGLPILSRTIRLASGVPRDEIIRYLTAETQRTLISASGQMSEQPIAVDRILVAGGEEQTSGLDLALSRQFGAEATIVRPDLLLEQSAGATIADGALQMVASGSYANLLAALKEEAIGVQPVVDFANPKRPPVQGRRSRQILAVVAVVLMMAGGGWYWVWSQFAEIDAENSRLTVRLNELNDLVKDTQAKRRLASSLSAWEKNRFSWLDELRDLTQRMPSSPDLVVQQLSISPAGVGRATVSFRGVGKQPEVIQDMERRLRDGFHELRIPGIREQQEGNKSTWSFQTTMTIRSRNPSQYKGPSEVAEKVTASKGSGVAKGGPDKAVAGNGIVAGRANPSSKSDQSGRGDDGSGVADK